MMSILEQVIGRRYFSQFLETVASQGLIGYWTAVEELRAAPRKNWHQLGAEVFYTFIRNPTAEIKVDKNTRRRIEAFLLGISVQSCSSNITVLDLQGIKARKCSTKYNKT